MDGLKYPVNKVMWCLGDNTNSVSGETGGAVAILKQQLKQKLVGDARCERAVDTDCSDSE